VAALPAATHPQAVVVPLVGGWDSSNPHLNSNDIARHMAERIGAGVRLLHAPGLLDNEATTAALLSDSAVTATTRFWGELRLALVGMSGAPRFAPGYGTVMDRLDDAGRSRLTARGARVSLWDAPFAEVEQFALAHIDTRGGLLGFADLEDFFDSLAVPLRAAFFVSNDSEAVARAVRLAGPGSALVDGGSATALPVDAAIEEIEARLLAAPD